jgi:hypothetical protein
MHLFLNGPQNDFLVSLFMSPKEMLSNIPFLFSLTEMEIAFRFKRSWNKTRKVDSNRKGKIALSLYSVKKHVMQMCPCDKVFLKQMT